MNDFSRYDDLLEVKHECWDWQREYREAREEALLEALQDEKSDWMRWEKDCFIKLGDK